MSSLHSDRSNPSCAPMASWPDTACSSGPSSRTSTSSKAPLRPAAWVSRTLGATTETYATASQGVTYGKDAPFLGTRSQGTTMHLARRDLFTPDEVMRLPAGTLLLFRQGAYPIRAAKVRYFADPEFQGLFDRPDASALSTARAVPV